MLHPAVLRDFLLRLSTVGLYQARWTETIVTETVDSIARQASAKGRPLEDRQLAHLRDRLTNGVPGAVVGGLDLVAVEAPLPDPDDEHVIAAAIRSGAQVIVTDNLSDFPPEVMAPLDLQAQSPDRFIEHVLDLPGGEAGVRRALREQSSALRNPPISEEAIVDRLHRLGLVASATRMRSIL